MNYIHKNYLDPKTKLPHPMVRLEQAFENSKIRIDPDASEVKQAEVLMKSLQGKLLFSKAEIEGELTVAKSYMGSCSNIVHSMTEVKREEYSASGVVWYIGISPGGTMFLNFFEFKACFC